MARVSSGNQFTLFAGQQLTVVSGESSGATVQLYVGNSVLSTRTVGASSAELIGPFSIPCQVVVMPTSGTVNADVQWVLQSIFDAQAVGGTLSVTELQPSGSGNWRAWEENGIAFTATEDDQQRIDSYTAIVNGVSITHAISYDGNGSGMPVVTRSL